jgi:hypothetical protein
VKSVGPWIAVLLTFKTAATAWGQIASDDTLQVIFVGGQSNALNLHADASQLAPLDLDSSIAFYYHTGLPPNNPAHPDPFIATSDSTWTHLQPQTQVPYVAYHEQFFGPEMTLGRMLAEHGMTNIGVFKIGYAGTHLAHDWQKGDDNGAGLYTLMLDQLAIATDSLLRWGTPWKFIGMAWMQGETDASNSEWAAAYETNLALLLAAMRADFNAPNLPVVLGQIAHTGAYPYSLEVRTAQAAVAAADPLVELIGLDDQPLDTDGIHFTAEGVMVMGARMGQALLSLYSTTGVARGLLDLPQGFSLGQNSPNPFNPVTEIEYSLPERSRVELTVYNLAGKEVARLVDRQQAAGRYTVRWEGRDVCGELVPAGIYLYRLNAARQIKTRKMVLLR